MPNKLMLITVGGVQEFIAKARKTKDFYNGSNIITQYLEKIKYILSDQCDTLDEFQVLLPYSSESNNKPNYFVSEITAKNCENNEKLESELRNKLKEEFKSDNDSSIYRSLEVYIAIVDYENTNEYEDSYDKLYEKLDAYKNDRFKDNSLISECQDNNNSNVRLLKCSVCGINDGKYIFKNDKESPEEYSGQRINFEGNDDYEILCEACRSKRNTSGIFESVKKIAGIKYNQCIENDTKNSEKLGSGTYYALIKADIDDLGKHFSGKYLRQENNLLKFQQALSKKISDFGMEVKDYLDSLFEGKKLCIYSGGDDILFFCPPYKIFETLNKIDMLLSEIQIQGYDREITMSKSIVISHVTVPLKKVITLSRTSLETAKEKFKKDDKNSIAISAIDSSSKVQTSYLKNKKENIDNIIGLINGFRCHISRSLIYDLERRLTILGGDMTYNEYSILNNVILNLMEQICDRKITEFKEEYISKFEKVFFEFVYVDSTYYYTDFKGYFSLLHILDRCSKEIKYEIAGGEEK